MNSRYVVAVLAKILVLSDDEPFEIWKQSGDQNV